MLSLSLIIYRFFQEDLSGSGYIDSSFLTLALDGNEQSALFPCIFNPNKGSIVPI
jgi:hypothetical protein